MTKPKILPINRGDLDAICNIDYECFGDDYYDEVDVRAFLMASDAWGYKIVLGRKIIGYMLYRHCLSRTELHRIAIDERWQGKGYGSALVEFLAGLNCFAIVHEQNLTAQLFFRAQGWRCTRIEKEDYRFESSTADRAIASRRTR